MDSGTGSTMSVQAAERPLSREIGVPLYEQVKRSITAMIDTGILKPGDRVLPTTDLCSRFGVSHITVTKALHDLAREGLVLRIQGKGTFVTDRRIERGLTSLLSFTREMARQGLTVRSKILGIKETQGTPLLNQRFSRPADDSTRYIEIQRLRFVDGGPACIATSIFPETVGRRLTQFPLEDASFYDLLENRLGLHLFREERWITPIVAKAKLARLLEVPQGAPLFRLEGITFLLGDVPIEATDTIFRGDRFRFVANLFRFIGDKDREDGVGIAVPPPHPWREG